MKDDVRKDGHIKLLPLCINVCKASKIANCWPHCGWVTFSPLQTVESVEQYISHCDKKNPKNKQKKPQQKTKNKTKINTNPQKKTQTKNQNKANQSIKQTTKHPKNPPKLESRLQSLIVYAFQNEEKLGSRQVPSSVYHLK